jgi:hypothetical protein
MRARLIQIRNGPRGLAWLVAIGLGLAACQNASGDDATTGDASADEAAAVEAPADAATDTPAETAEVPGEAAPPEIAAVPPEPPPPPEPVIDDNPDRLFGLDRTALSALLGEPALIRREAPAEIWQYRTATCVFDVFLYDAADTSRVQYIEARDSAAQQIDARGCLNQLLRAHMGLPLG